MSKAAAKRTILTIKQPYKTSKGETLYLGTSTEVEVDANGKYIPSSAVISLRLYTGEGFLGADYKTVALRNAGEPWRLTQDGNGNTVAGIDLQETLANKNSLMNINLNNHVSNALSAPLQGVPAGQVNTNTKTNADAAIKGPSAPPTAPNPGIGDTSGATSTPLSIQTINDASKGIPGRPPRPSYDNLRYPHDLGSTKSDAVKFTMLSYGTKSYSEERLGLSEDRKNTAINGSVTMSIQPPIADFNAVNWNGLEMNMLAMAAAGGSLEIIDQGTSAISGLADKIKGTTKLEPGLVDAITTLAAQEAASSKGLLTRVTGAMFNNNLELLFQGPQLRQFTFTFKMSPRYQEESESVKKIIRFFKQGSSVQRSTTSLFLKSPNVFNIEYLNRRDGKDSPHKSLNKIKTCALISCSVDYTPTGSYMTFNDQESSMVSYTLSLTFNELEPVYEDEYDKDDSQGIGL